MIEYAENPDKTTDPRYLDDDLSNVLKYAEKDEKTDQRLFVAGINCPKQRAYETMMAVKRRFGKTGGTVAWHGFQSFAEGEVTPDEAFEIGKETARRMWGDKYQVVVTVHLNTDNLHCHFVVNPISFKDGSRFQNKIYNHRRLREISDEVCREHGKSVLENSSFYGGKSRGAYWAEKKGQPTHRDMLKRDIEYCLSVSYTRKTFYQQLHGLGYEIDYTRMSVKGKGWDRAVRLRGIGYTDEVIEKRLNDHYSHGWAFVRDVWNVNLPKKNKSILLSYIAHELGYNIEHSHDVAEIYIDLLFLIIIEALRAVKEIKNTVIMSVELRHKVKDLKQLIYDYNFLREADIHTLPQLDKYIEGSQTKIKELERERSLLRNKVRRETDPAVLANNRAARSEITNKHIEPLRKKLKRAEKIREKSPYLHSLLEQELDMEAPYCKLDRDGKIAFKDTPEREAR
ncbi:MAG: relaxase/mobilization nuclease domain-containing protein [Clostridia bacterium]|nr:relaxase/mobilization nuclease domain-containing protein [Clostridia bacterium]